ncbi:MAG: hypothetical protein LBV46_04370, partial [Bacteroidales bacterium]|nr:hypothetical protein [Bacteroidales bacterium]
SNTTIRGNCYYKTEDYSDKNREEYVLTHFAMRADFPITDGSVYVFGALTDWQLKEDARLIYNPTTKYYEAILLLKQGYYNYQYVYVKNRSNIIDETYIEGSHWQTDNEYTVLLYLREEGATYDKLVSATVFHIADK